MINGVYKLDYLTSQESISADKINPQVRSKFGSN
jgi:hypothetical protein